MFSQWQCIYDGLLSRGFCKSTAMIGFTVIREQAFSIAMAPSEISLGYVTHESTVGESDIT